MSKIVLEWRDLGPDSRVAVLFLDDPSTKNSFSLEMGMAFQRELNTLAGASPLPRALIITGRNELFSSGGNYEMLKNVSEKGRRENQEFMESFYRLFLSVRHMPFPVIACVNGHAIGAGLALSLACDLRYFVSEAKYAFNFVRIGVHSGMGSLFLLKEIAGLAVAQELLLTGRSFSGKEAFERRLCHGVYEKEDVFERSLDVAKEIASAAPIAVRLLKQGLCRDLDLESCLKYEAQCQATTYASEDFREALRSIEEKRPPVFRDL